MSTKHVCACGCGTPTKKIVKRAGGRTVKPGTYYKFANGHQHRVHRASGSNFHDPEWHRKRGVI